MGEKHRNIFDVRIVLGLLIVLTGAVLLLQNMGVIDNIHLNVWDFWPILLIVFGLTKIFQTKECRQPLMGLILVALGTVFLLEKILPHFDVRWSHIWPFALILLGLVIIKNVIWIPKHAHCHSPLKKMKNGSKPEFSHFGKYTSSASEYINLSAILGGGGYRYDSKNLTGGRITAIMGGADLDLRDADIEGDSMILDLFALMGGIEIKVPETWSVVNNATVILGGVEDTTVSPAKKGKEVILRGSAIMGGLEVKN